MASVSVSNKEQAVTCPASNPGEAPFRPGQHPNLSGPRCVVGIDLTAALGRATGWALMEGASTVTVRPLARTTNRSTKPRCECRPGFDRPPLRPEDGEPDTPCEVGHPR